jgi:predicted amidohydrolase
MSTRPATLRLAVVQPHVDSRADATTKVAAAVAAIEAAADDGAQLVVFPEAYPGPLRTDHDYDAAPALVEVAGRRGCGVYWGRIELVEGAWETVGYLVDETGTEVVRYPRSHPATGDVHPVLNGAPMVPGPALVTGTVHGVEVGLLVCSELWLCEPARVLTLRGAEVLLAPAGGGFGAVADNWQVIARARAIENQSHVALTQNRIDGEPGTATIAGPESVLAASRDDSIVIATLDLERARWLRDKDDSMESPKPFTSLPGLLRARRPELYGALTEPRTDAYDYEAAGRAGGAAGGRR